MVPFAKNLLVNAGDARDLGPWVQSLVKELRFHKLCGRAKKKRVSYRVLQR